MDDKYNKGIIRKLENNEEGKNVPLSNKKPNFIKNAILLGALAGWAMIATHISYWEKQKNYEQSMVPACKKAMGRYDENKSGTLEGKEVINLARDCGYTDNFSNNPGFAYLFPGNAKEKDAILKFSNLSEEYKFPIAKLQELRDADIHMSFGEMIKRLGIWK